MKLAQPCAARWIVALTAAVMASGCAVARVTVDSAAGGAPAPAPEATPMVMHLDFSAPENDTERARQEIIEASRALDGTAVFFETAKAELSDEGKVKLQRVAEVLRRYPAFRIRIEGNADDRGTEEYNYDLAYRRACNARNYLVSLQVNPRQVTCVSNGEAMPLAPGKTEVDRKLNRRNDVVPVTDK
ncbi:MAG: OmpA family protein [Myxococcales bacterium]|jgi:peptidoglycan-associated lipoprotein